MYKYFSFLCIYTLYTYYVQNKCSYEVTHFLPAERRLTSSELNNLVTDCRTNPPCIVLIADQ